MTFFFIEVSQLDTSLTVICSFPSSPSLQDLLHTVFQNGKIVKTYTFDDVRDNAKITDSDLKELLH